MVFLLHFIVLVGALRRVHNMKRLPTGLIFWQDHTVQGLGLRLVPVLASQRRLAGSVPKGIRSSCSEDPWLVCFFCQVGNKLSSVTGSPFQETCLRHSRSVVHPYPELTLFSLGQTWCLLRWECIQQTWPLSSKIHTFLHLGWPPRHQVSLILPWIIKRHRLMYWNFNSLIVRSNVSSSVSLHLASWSLESHNVTFFVILTWLHHVHAWETSFCWEGRCLQMSWT